MLSNSNKLHAYRTTQSLLSAAVHVTEKHLRWETLGAVSNFFPGNFVFNNPLDVEVIT